MISKKEQILRYMLEKTLLKKRTLSFEQQEVAQALKFSISTVFNALKVPRQSGAVEVRGRGFEIRDIEKLLTIWATMRKLKKDILYETHSDDTVQRIESEMPSSITFGAYSAYKFRFHDTPADYDKVIVYAANEAMKEIEKRFPAKKGIANLVVLEADPHLKDFGSHLPNSQLFADLWNLSDWFARDYLNALRKKIGL